MSSPVSEARRRVRPQRPWRWIPLCLVLAGPALAQAHDDLLTRARERLGLSGGRLVRLDLAGGPAEVLSVPLTVDGGADLLELHPHSVRAEGFQLLASGPDGRPAAVEPPPVSTLRGALVARPGSRVAGSLLEDGLHARLRMEDGSVRWLLPLSGRVPGADFEDHVLVDEADVLSPEDGVCGADEGLLGPAAPLGGGGALADCDGIQLAEIACDADYEYYAAYGGIWQAAQEIEKILNLVNEQFERDVGITHAISAIMVRTAPGDPYVGDDLLARIYQFRDEWNANWTWQRRDVAQLFSGLPFPKKGAFIKVLGAAWKGTICDLPWAYGVVRDHGSLPCRTDVSAHELGHGWNADHQSDNTYTMYSSSTCSNRFHPSATVPEISAFRDSRTCLDEYFPTSELFYDGFESGWFGGGGWVASGKKAKVVGFAAHTGNYGAKLKHDHWIEKSISTAEACKLVRVELDWRTIRLDAGEGLVVEFWDSDFPPEYVHVATLKGKGWQHSVFDLPAAALGDAGFKLRLRMIGNAINEKIYVDDVRIVVQ